MSITFVGNNLRVALCLQLWKKRFVIYIYTDPQKLHKHFGHFGNPISGERESERERRKGKRGERERESREREERERIVIPAGCAISRALSRAISSALYILSISSCNFLCSFSCNFLCIFSCFTFNFLVQFSGATVTGISRPPPKKRRKKQKTPVPVCTFCFNCCELAASKQIKTN